MTGVCIIVENSTVPPDTRVWRQARALVEAGYRVSVICPKRPGFSEPFEVIEGVEIYRHASWESSFKLGYFFEYAWSLAAEFALALTIYRRTQFRILHACNPPDNIFLIALFLKLFGVRFVFDHHDLVPELFEVKFGHKGWLYRIVRLMEQWTYRTADVALATNETCRDAVIARGADADRIFVVRNCPRLADFELSAPERDLKEGKDCLVLYVGVMESQDGVDLLLDSIHHIVQERGRRDTLFALVGWGSEVDRLKTRCEKLGLEDWVRFTGPLYGKELHEYLFAADIGVAPDPLNIFNDKLTMIKILEYMACALPVVLYDLKEGRRSAGDGALYAEANDQRHFGAQVIALLDSEQSRKRLGEIGKRRIMEQLNWDQEKLKLLQAYERVLGLHRCRARNCVYE